MAKQKPGIFRAINRAYAVFVNGPPQAGKDTIADTLTTDLNTQMRSGYALTVKFADPLKQAVGEFLGLSAEERRYFFETGEGKATLAEAFFGRTPREVLISFSETWAKPLFGSAVFGELMAQRIYNEMEGQHVACNTVFVISDSGFQSEYDAVMRHIPPNRSWLLRVERPGRTFAGDSREYVQPAGGCETDVVQNDGDLEALRNKCSFIVSRILDVVEPEWPTAA